MKNTFLNLTLIGLFGFLFTSLSHAQLDSPIKEIGFQFDALGGIGNSVLSFKKEGKKQKYFRLRARWSSDARSIPLTSEWYNTYYALLGIGFEKRVDFKERTQLFAGAEANVFTDWSNDFTDKSKQKSLQYGAGLGVPIGVIFKFSEQWNITLETVPTLHFARVDFDETTGQRFEEVDQIQATQQGYYVGVAYRFAKAKKS